MLAFNATGEPCDQLHSGREPFCGCFFFLIPRKTEGKSIYFKPLEQSCVLVRDKIGAHTGRAFSNALAQHLMKKAHFSIALVSKSARSAKISECV